MENGQLCSDDDLPRLMARNALLQYDEIRRLAELGRNHPAEPVFSTATVRRLHLFATADIYNFAGEFRDGDVGIDGTKHKPPPAEEVVQLVDEMVSYVHDNWHATPVHLCSYLLWRCNWIHPFFNGNGRTTRGTAYLAFLLRLGFEPGGSPSFVEVISANQPIYYSALDAADAPCAAGRLDVSEMEALVSDLIGQQLLRIGIATGALPST